MKYYTAIHSNISSLIKKIMLYYSNMKCFHRNEVYWCIVSYYSFIHVFSNNYIKAENRFIYFSFAYVYCEWIYVDLNEYVLLYVIGFHKM